MKKILPILCILYGAALPASELTNIKTEQTKVSQEISANKSKSLETRRALARTADILQDIENEKVAVADKISAISKQREELEKEILATNRNLSDTAAALVSISISSPSYDETNTENYAVTMSLLGSISEDFDQEMQIAWDQINKLKALQSQLEKEHKAFAKAQSNHKKEMSKLEGLLRARAEQNKVLLGKQDELKRRLNNLSAGARDVSDLANKVSPRVPVGKWQSGRKMRFPAPGMLLLGFGDKNSLGIRTNGWRVRTVPNAIVSATADGKIEFADYFKGYNHIVIINHMNGYYSVVTGMSNLNVLINQEVLAGEPIGQMPPSSPEIYMELRYGEKPIDPARMFLLPK